MKRRVGILLLVVLCGLLILLIGGTVYRKANAEDAADKINRLPDLVLTDLYGKSFRTAQVTSGPLLITFFHPECDHCRYEISSLLGSGLLDNDLIVLLISYADRSEIQSFVHNLGIAETSNLHVIHDLDFRVSKLFGADIIPSNYVYSDSLHLVKVLKGSTRPETIVKYLNDND